MSIIAAGESIWFAQWNGESFTEYPAICRVSPSTDHGECNLSYFDDGVESQANNVKNIEDVTLGATESYWRRRYSQADLSFVGNSFLDTVRIEKGEMCLYRKWNTSEFWADAFYAVCVATLGSPSDPHPRINLRYIDESGTSQLVSNISPLEKYDNEDDAQGNDIWTNLPPGPYLQSMESPQDSVSSNDDEEKPKKK